MEIQSAVLSVGLLIVTAKLLEGIFRRFKLNAIFAYAIAGLVLGPVGGLVEDSSELDLILGLGIFIFFFLIGLEELDIRGFVAAIRGRLFLASVLSVAISLLISLAVTTDFLFDLHLDLDFTQALGLAGVLSLSSLGLVAKVLIDEGRLKERVGVQIFTAVIIAELIALFVVGFTISEHFGSEENGQGLSWVSVLVLVGQILGFAIVTWLVSTLMLPRVIVLLHRFPKGASAFIWASARRTFPGCSCCRSGRAPRVYRGFAVWSGAVDAALPGEARHYARDAGHGRGVVRSAVFRLCRSTSESRVPRSSLGGPCSLWLSCLLEANS